MKLVSPFQRGTTWMCRWSRMPAPATRPWLSPTLKPSGRYSALSARTPAGPAAMASASSPGVASSSADVTVDDRHQMAGGVGEGVEDEEGVLAALQEESPRGRRPSASASQKTQPASGAFGRSIQAMRHGAQRRSTRRGRPSGVDELAQALADLEERHPLLGDARRGRRSWGCGPCGSCGDGSGSCRSPAARPCLPWRERR